MRAGLPIAVGHVPSHSAIRMQHIDDNTIKAPTRQHAMDGFIHRAFSFILPFLFVSSPSIAAAGDAAAFIPIHNSLLLASAPLRDPVLDELQDGARLNGITLPPSEQRRNTALQDLEDERLEECRSKDVGAFDQCFFFGSMDTMQSSESRRAMEGGGSILPQFGGGGGSSSSSKPRAGIPTW